MRILIDTHILIWHLEDDEKLSSYHGLLIEDPANTVSISVASFWEIAIKVSRGKLSLSRPMNEIVSHIQQSTITVMAIEPEHTIQVAQLPFIHNDPFDRMIVAQALAEDLSLISTDSDFTKYGVTLL